MGNGRVRAILHWLTISLLTFYFLFCCLFLGLRWFVTTYIDDYREDITEMVSEATGINIKASKFSIGFYYIWPTVTLENVELSRPGGPVSLTLPLVQGQLSWSSLWHFEPRFRHFSIQNPNLTVRRLSDTQIDVAGFVLPIPADFSPSHIGAAATVPNAGLDTRLTTWLLSQDRLELINGSVIYLDKEEHPIRLSDVDFIFEQELLHWRTAIRGTAHTDAVGRDFQLKTIINKNLFLHNGDPKNWTGQTYIQFAKTDIARLVSKFGLRRFFTSGTASTEMWLNFENGRVTRSTIDLALTGLDLTLNPELPPLRIQWLGTRLNYETSHSDTVLRTLTVENLDFLTENNEHLGNTNLTISARSDTTGHFTEGNLQASRIDFRPLISIARRLPIPTDVREFLQKHPLTGELTNVNIGFIGDPQEPANWHARSSFKNLSLPVGHDTIPGFSGLSGQISPLPQTGGFGLTLDSHQVRLTFPGVFRRENINLDRLYSTLEFSFAPQPTLKVLSLEASNSEASVTAEGSWIGTGGPGTLNLTGKILRGKAEAVHHYIPRILGEKLLDWLEAGILDGDITNGNYRVEGPLTSFPWDDTNQGKGLFRIAADVKHGKLDFLPSHQKNINGEWQMESEYPILRDIDAHLLFEGNSMDIRGKSARSEGLQASDVVVRIPSYITDSRLLIEGRIQGDLSNALGYVNGSHQLNQILSGAFLQSQGSGKADMHLKLDMPFSDPKAIKVNLALSLTDAELQYGYGLPYVKHINGNLSITEKSVSTPMPIEGQTDAGPLTVNIRTEDNRITLMTQGFVTSTDLARLIDLNTATPFLDQVSGKTPVLVQTVIGLKEPHLSVSGTSDLIGLSSALPAPYTKTDKESWPLTFNWARHENGHVLDLHSFGHASMTLRFEKTGDKTEWTSGSIALGLQRKMPVTNDQINIAMITPTLSLNDWLPYAEKVDAILRKNSQTIPPVIPSTTAERSPMEKLGTIRLLTDELKWYDKRYPNVEAVLRQFNQKNWHLRIGGNQLLSGSVTYESATDTHSDVLTFKFGHLHLPVPTNSSSEQTGSVRSASQASPNLPDMTVVIDDLRIGDMSIGKVVAHAQNRLEKQQQYWDIRRLDIFNRGGKISGQGMWTHAPGQEGRTTIDVLVDIDNMGTVLSSLSVENAMKGAPTHASAKLSWQGMPFKPRLETLSGNVTSESGSGSFLQIEPGAGRLLSLLSMQHLLHRLTLDFRDVLSQGFTFDSLFLSGTVENGLLTIPKATVFGSAATVVLGGKADIPNETLDAKAVILPAINAAGPSLALALVNPAVGIGTFLTQLILKDQLSNIFRMEYDIKGTFDNPILTKIDLANKMNENRNAAVQ